MLTALKIISLVGGTIAVGWYAMRSIDRWMNGAVESIGGKDLVVKPPRTTRDSPGDSGNG